MVWSARQIKEAKEGLPITKGCVCMKLTTIRSLWGYPLPPSEDSAKPAFYAQMMKSTLDLGYAGVEAIMLTVRDPYFLEALKESQLRLVIQLHTDGSYLTDQFEYVYCKSCSVEAHVTSLKALVSEVETLMKPLPGKLAALNVHAGHDSWASTPASSAFFAACAAVTASVPIYYVRAPPSSPDAFLPV